MVQWLTGLFQSFDHNAFNVRFRNFERLVERPDVCKSATRAGRLWEWQAKNTLHVIEDNVVHVRWIANQLVTQELLADNSDDGKASLQVTLRRMFALLSWVHGMCAESGLLCTVMDQLLEDLAKQLVGHVDPKTETYRMLKVAQTLAELDDKWKTLMPSLGGDSEETTPMLRKEHRARMLFSELARMYRGAIILSVAEVSGASHHKQRDCRQEWYQELIKWCDDCGYPSCSRQLKVAQMPYGPPEGDKQKMRWTISVSVDDARLGFPEERFVVLPPS